MKVALIVLAVWAALELYHEKNNKYKYYATNLMKIIVGLEEQIALQHKIIFSLRKAGILEDVNSQDNQDENIH